MRIGLIFVIAVIIFVAFKASRTHFVCSKCEGSFKVSVLKYMFTIHVFGKRMVKCSYCGNTELTESYWDEK